MKTKFAAIFFSLFSTAAMATNGEFQCTVNSHDLTIVSNGKTTHTSGVIGEPNLNKGSRFTITYGSGYGVFGIEAMKNGELIDYGPTFSWEKLNRRLTTENKLYVDDRGQYIIFKPKFIYVNDTHLRLEMLHYAYDKWHGVMSSSRSYSLGTDSSDIFNQRITFNCRHVNNQIKETIKELYHLLN